MWVAAEDVPMIVSVVQAEKYKLSSLRMHRMQLQILASTDETNSDMSITANNTTEKEKKYSKYCPPN